jgi:hypothetical protein
MENKTTFIEIRKFLKPWLNTKSRWNENTVKIYKSNDKLVVSVCYSIIYDNKPSDNFMIQQIKNYLIQRGFDYDGSGRFTRKENLVDSENSLIFE